MPPFMNKDGTRNYKKQLAWEKEKKPNAVKDRAARNKARRQLGLKVGDPRHADHKQELTDGGSKGLKNVRAVSAKTNLKKEGARKAAVAKRKKK